MFLKDLLELDIDTEVELFEISEINGQSNTEVFRFCAYDGVIFDSYYYSAIPCKVDGIEYTSEGVIPRPKLTVSDIPQYGNGELTGLISGLMSFYDGIEGSRLTIKRTLKRYLDGQPDANPFATKPSDIYLISQVTQLVPGKFIELELCADFDFVDEEFPRRICSKTCPWIYMGTECGYQRQNGMFTINNYRTLDPNLDVCGKTITSCEKRFGRTVLPFGGFPAINSR